MNPDVGFREVLEVGFRGSSRTPGNTLHPVTLSLISLGTQPLGEPHNPNGGGGGDADPSLRGGGGFLMEEKS